MRVILKKIGALLLAFVALVALLAQAAFTHGCGGGARQGEAQAPGAGTGSPEPSGVEHPTAGEEAEERKEYMGATKAPPLDAFRRSPKSAAGSDVDETEDARDDGAQQQAP